MNVDRFNGSAGTAYNVSDDWSVQNGSTNSTNETSNESSQFVEDFAKVITFLDNYFLLVIIVIGLVGNALSFCVFVFTYLNRLSSSVYLAALACADAGFLFCLLVSWSNNIGIHLYNTPGWCQTFVYLTYVCSFLSVWFVVCFTVERYVAVCIPLRRQDMCTPRRAKIVVVALSAVSAVLYNFALWTSAVRHDIHIGMPYCFPLKKYYSIINYASNIDTVLTLVVPSGTIIICNVRIIYAIMRLQRQRRRSEQMERLNSMAQNSGVRMHYKRGSQSSQIKVTQMLIVVSSMFLVLNLPSHVMRLYAFIMTIAADSFRTSKLFALTQRLFLYVYYVNFSINFFLYSACGRNFRCAMTHLGKNIRYRVVKCFRWRRNTDENGDDTPVIAKAQRSSSSSGPKRLNPTGANTDLVKGENPRDASSGKIYTFPRVVMQNGLQGDSL